MIVPPGARARIVERAIAGATLAECARGLVVGYHRQRPCSRTIARRVLREAGIAPRRGRAPRQLVIQLGPGRLTWYSDGRAVDLGRVT